MATTRAAPRLCEYRWKGFARAGTDFAAPGFKEIGKSQIAGKLGGAGYFLDAVDAWSGGADGHGSSREFTNGR